MTEPLLDARGLWKTYGQVEALRGAGFTVYPGEVVALIGDNGAGKSTLVKTLVGAVAPDEGEILLDGRPVSFAGPRDAQRLGIETVYQDLALAADLDAAANLFLGRERLRPGLLGAFGVLDKRGMREHSVAAFAELGVELKDIDAPVATLSGASGRAWRSPARWPGPPGWSSWTSRPPRSACSSAGGCST